MDLAFDHSGDILHSHFLSIDGYMSRAASNNSDEAMAEAWRVLNSCIAQQTDGLGTILIKGLYASDLDRDNYKRIWARDAMIAGLAIVLTPKSGNELKDAFRASVLALASQQAANGQIPSNIGIGPDDKPSYGSLVGRVDATTWWIIGACILGAQDPDIKMQLAAPVAKAIEMLKAWEFNQRGLLYTPLGGNWADEYLVQGYTLYDNCLYLWALRAAAKVYSTVGYMEQAATLERTIVANYLPGGFDQSSIIHPTAYADANQQMPDGPYFWCCFGPQGYDTRWDMAGNALALLLGLHPDPDKLVAFLSSMAKGQGHWLLPVFSPVVEPTDWQWQLLRLNYTHAFKNQPHHFHNGGCWPVFMGMLSLGLAANCVTALSATIESQIIDALNAEVPPYSFHEYWTTDHQQPSGVSPLAYTATGTILACLAAQYQSKQVVPNLTSILCNDNRKD